MCCVPCCIFTSGTSSSCSSVHQPLFANLSIRQSQYPTYHKYLEPLLSLISYNPKTVDKGKPSVVTIVTEPVRFQSTPDPTPRVKAANGLLFYWFLAKQSTVNLSTIAKEKKRKKIFSRLFVPSVLILEYFSIFLNLFWGGKRTRTKITSL